MQTGNTEQAKRIPTLKRIKTGRDVFLQLSIAMNMLQKFTTGINMMRLCVSVEIQFILLLLCFNDPFVVARTK